MTSDMPAQPSGSGPPELGDRFYTRHQHPRTPSLPPSEEFVKVILNEQIRSESLKCAKVLDLDVFLRKLGNPGWFQVLTFIVLTLSYTVVAPNNIAMLFFGEEPSEYQCNNDTNLEFDQSLNKNYTVVTTYGPTRNVRTTVTVQSTDAAEDLDNDQAYYSFYPGMAQQCIATKNSSGGNVAKTECSSWTFPGLKNKNGRKPRTITTEFQLVCKYKWMTSLATTIYFLGVMIGAALFGFMSDRVGRRLTMLITATGTVVFGIAASLAPNYITFVVLRFVLGLFVQGIQGMYVLVMEWFPAERRGFVGTLTECVWSVSVMVLALYAYLFPNWNHLQLAIAINGLILTILYFFLIQESLRWLLVANRTADAVDVSTRVLKFNRLSKELSWEMENELLQIAANIQEKESKTRYSFVDCFRTRKMLTITACNMYIWFSLALGYYALSFSLDQLVGNTALNLFIGGALELIPCTACTYIVPRYGRKRPTMIMVFTGALACLLSCAIRGQSRSVLLGKTALILLGRMGFAGSFSSIIVWNSELYPTVIRANGLGMGMFGLRVGGVLSPQIVLLGAYTFKELPVILLGITALIGVLACIPLEETLGKKLPDTLEEMEQEKRQPEKRVKHDDSLSSGTSHNSPDFVIAETTFRRPNAPRKTEIHHL